MNQIVCGQNIGPGADTSRDRLKNQPVVDIEIGGVTASCLLDTDSQISTITESFFKELLYWVVTKTYGLHQGGSGSQQQMVWRYPTLSVLNWLSSLGNGTPFV